MLRIWCIKKHNGTANVCFAGVRLWKEKIIHCVLCTWLSKCFQKQILLSINIGTFESLMHFICIKVNVYHYLCAYPPHLHAIIHLYLCDFLVLDFHKADIQHQLQLCCSFPNRKLKLITQSTSSNMSNVVF